MVHGRADREAATAALDLHKGISDPGGCKRWPEAGWLVNSQTGEAVRGRCRATNLCDYCAKLAAVENSELLALDAMEYAPNLWVVLTTRTATTDHKRFWRSREQVWSAVRRRWPGAEYAYLVEFTTGYGPRSGGARRPHWNLLVKGVPNEDIDELRDVVTSVWCRREDALPAAQFVGPVQDAGGLMRYLALHFQKESQAPPKGWRGHRFRCSRGYLVRPASELRQEARRSLRLKRLIWRGVPAELAELELELAEAMTWTLQFRNPSTLRTAGEVESDAKTDEWARDEGRDQDQAAGGTTAADDAGLFGVRLRRSVDLGRCDDGVDAVPSLRGVVASPRAG